MSSDLTVVYNGFIAGLLFGETNHETDESLDENYFRTDIAPESQTYIRWIVEDFLKLVEEQGIEWWCHYDKEDFGINMYFTMAGHGVGFWELLDEQGVGKKLTELCRPYGDVNVYVGDDDLIYVD